jgi:hypothetical protein
MAREKEYFRDVVAEIVEKTGKMELGVRDVMAYLKVGYPKALKYMGGEDKINVFKLASKLL